jgi:hypothetical protein
MSFGGDYGARERWLVMNKGMDMGRSGAISDFLELAKDHYWDSLEPQKEMILLHLETMAETLLKETNE